MQNERAIRNERYVRQVLRAGGSAYLDQEPYGRAASRMYELRFDPGPGDQKDAVIRVSADSAYDAMTTFDRLTDPSGSYDRKGLYPRLVAQVSQVIESPVPRLRYAVRFREVSDGSSLFDGAEWKGIPTEWRSAGLADLIRAAASEKFVARGPEDSADWWETSLYQDWYTEARMIKRLYVSSLEGKPLAKDSAEWVALNMALGGIPVISVAFAASSLGGANAPSDLEVWIVENGRGEVVSRQGSEARAVQAAADYEGRDCGDDRRCAVYRRGDPSRDPGCASDSLPCADGGADEDNAGFGPAPGL